MSDRPKRWYYFANERGCLRHPDSLDELGFGGASSATIRLLDLRDRLSMKLAVHSDEWRVFAECADVFKALSQREQRSLTMKTDESFYKLRSVLEGLGYENLGKL